MFENKYIRLLKIPWYMRMILLFVPMEEMIVGGICGWLVKYHYKYYNGKYYYYKEEQWNPEI